MSNQSLTHAQFNCFQEFTSTYFSVKTGFLKYVDEIKYCNCLL